MPVRHHSFALCRRQLLELLISLHHTVTLIRRQTAPARVVMLQFIATRLGKLAPPAQSLEHSLALFGRQIAERLEVLLHLLPFLGPHRLPSPIILDHALTLIEGEVCPFPRMLRRERALGIAGLHRCARRCRRLRMSGSWRRESTDDQRSDDERARDMPASRHCCGPSTS